jgi:hypothetical protein
VFGQGTGLSEKDTPFPVVYDRFVVKDQDDVVFMDNGAILITTEPSTRRHGEEIIPIPSTVSHYMPGKVTRVTMYELEEETR